MACRPTLIFGDPDYFEILSTEAGYEPLPRHDPDVRIAGVVVWSAHRYGSD